MAPALEEACLQRYTPRAAAALTFASEPLEALLAALRAGSHAVVAAATPALFTALPSTAERTEVLLALLALAQRAADARLRAATQDVLAELLLPPDFLAPLLEWSGAGTTPAAAAAASEAAAAVAAPPPPKKRSRGRKSKASVTIAEDASAKAPKAMTRSLDDVVAVLQLVQSRPALARAALLAPLLRLLRTTAAACASAAPSGAEGEGEEAAGASASSAASAQYAQLLALQAIDGIVSRAGETGEVVEVPVEGVELIVDAARTTSDGAIRAAALGALAVVAQVDPQQVRRTRKRVRGAALSPICVRPSRQLPVTVRILEIGEDERRPCVQPSHQRGEREFELGHITRARTPSPPVPSTDLAVSRALTASLPPLLSTCALMILTGARPRLGGGVPRRPTLDGRRKRLAVARDAIGTRVGGARMGICRG